MVAASYDFLKTEKESKSYLQKIVIFVWIFFITFGLILICMLSIESNTKDNTVTKYLEGRKDLNLSKLGEVLFLQYEYPAKKNKTLKILIWKDGDFLKRRHVNFFSSESHDPFSNCSVNNCVLSYEDDDISDADAVVILLLKLTLSSLPNNSLRTPQQRWIFLTDENPYNTFLDKQNDFRKYSGIFNWSMSYKMESDVPVPYGRIIPRALDNIQLKSSSVESLIPNIEIKQRNILVAIVINDCSIMNPVYSYVKELQKYIAVDVYGNCDNNKRCITHLGKDCPELNNYLFYLALETVNCRDFFTHYVFWNSYAKGSVPIIAGVSLANCKINLPPESFIHISNFNKAENLAAHILKLNNTWEQEYIKLHGWRQYFEVLNEHGYYGSRSYHYCRVCEALNYNDNQPKVYNDLSDFLSARKNCIL